MHPLDKAKTIRMNRLGYNRSVTQNIREMQAEVKSRKDDSLDQIEEDISDYDNDRRRNRDYSKPYLANDDVYSQTQSSYSNAENLPSYMKPLKRKTDKRRKELGFNRTVTQHLRDLKGEGEDKNTNTKEWLD